MVFVLGYYYLQILGAMVVKRLDLANANSESDWQVKESLVYNIKRLGLHPITDKETLTKLK